MNHSSESLETGETEWSVARRPQECSQPRPQRGGVAVPSNAHPQGQSSMHCSKENWRPGKKCGNCRSKALQLH
jgi:hypothetical protein